jgi:hypothetical protein
VQGIAPPGAAELFAQREHVPFGLKEGRARCTTSRRFRSEEEKKGRNPKLHLRVRHEVRLCAHDSSFPDPVYLPPPSPVLWNCQVRGIAPPGAAGLLAQRGQVPLGYKRGVPVARPREGLRSEDERGQNRKGKKH